MLIRVCMQFAYFGEYVSECMYMSLLGMCMDVVIVNECQYTSVCVCV